MNVFLIIFSIYVISVLIAFWFTSLGNKIDNEQHDFFQIHPIVSFIPCVNWIVVLFGFVMIVGIGISYLIAWICQFKIIDKITTFIIEKSNYKSNYYDI